MLWLAGEWRDNMRDGLGVWIGSNGEVYEGQWKQGKSKRTVLWLYK